jgi:hypothetical protein
MLFSAETICNCGKRSSTPEKIKTLNDFSTSCDSTVARM